MSWSAEGTGMSKSLAFVLFATVAGNAVSADLEVSAHDLAGRPLQDAVVYAEPVGAAAAPAADHATAHAIIDQVNKEFVPRVTVIRTNTEVTFPNSDAIRHSIYSFSAPKSFTTKLYSGRQAPPVVFDKPGLVVLGCNIHDSMAAWVVIVDTPHFAKTAANGAASLRGLEPGNYRVKVWYQESELPSTFSEIHAGPDAKAHVDVKVDT